MSYQITLSNGSVLVNVADDTLDYSSTSLVLLGRNYLGYGTYIADNFVRLLENASNTVPPANQLVGQLWYNSATTVMSVWTGTQWLPLAIGVSSVLGQTGAIALTQLINGGLAPSISPILTGIPQAPTAAIGTDTNQIASTAFVLNEVASLSTGVISVIGYSGIVTLEQLVSGGLAPQASPTLTGLPKAPTAPLGTSTTQIASTAFVINQIGALNTGVISVLGNTGIVTLLQMTNGGLAPITSPAFSGIPLAATAAPLTATTQLATTAFVTNAINALPKSTGYPKTRLIAPLNLYVATNGNDSNAGTTLTTAFLTLQQAWNVILYNYDLSGYLVTVNIADGSYPAGVTCSGSPVGAALFANLATGNFGSSYGGNSPVLFKGSSGNASNCIITTINTPCFNVSFGAQIDVSAVTLLASGAAAPGSTNGSALLATNGGYIGALNVIFGNCGNSHMEAYGGLIGTGDSYTVSGSATNHFLATRMGHINANNTNINFIGGGVIFQVFAQAEYASVVEIGASTFSNTNVVSGQRYFAQYGGIIDPEGGDNLYLPGSSTGSVDASTYGMYLLGTPPTPTTPTPTPITPTPTPTTPTQNYFSITGLKVNSLYTTAALYPTVSGTVAISVVDVRGASPAPYILVNGAQTTSTTISAGQYFTINGTTATTHATRRDFSVTLGGVVSAYYLVITTASGPDPFTIPAITGASPNALTTSAAVSCSGNSISNPMPISIAGGGSPQFSIVSWPNSISGPWTTLSTIFWPETFVVRLTSASVGSVTATVSIGGGVFDLATADFVVTTG